MRKLPFLWFFCFTLLPVNGYSQDLNHIRNQYQHAAADKDICQALIEELKNVNEIDGVELAYLGALETIWANHVSNPFSKLRTFNIGKEKIETAVKRTPDDPEIRYLRLSVQENAPGFLGYNNEIETDRKYLKNNLDNVESRSLRTRIEEILDS